MTGLLSIPAKDGSRHFASLPATRDCYEVRDHVQDLEGAALTRFHCDGVTEAWIEFAPLGESFSINDQFGEYWFFVGSSTCPEQALHSVKVHWAALLGRGA